MARNAGLLGLLVALIAAAGCAGGRSVQPASQALRTCVDRWRQDNMVGYRYDAGPAEVAILNPGHELSQALGLKRGMRSCVVMLGPRPSDPAYCVLGSNGAFSCPYSPVIGPRRTTVNATLSKTGVLKLDLPLGGTHPAGALPWQRYPHVDSYIHPWTDGGRLRPGLRLVAWNLGHGSCNRGSEEIPDSAAITCVLSNYGRTGPCYPQKRRWSAGDIAACGGVGRTFYRLRITGGHS